MVSWEDRPTDGAVVDDDDNIAGVINNYYDEEDSDMNATALVLTAIFCFLGGILVQAFVQYFLNSNKDKSKPLAATNNIEMSSSSSSQA